MAMLWRGIGAWLVRHPEGGSPDAGREHRSALPRRRHCLHGVLARATPRPQRALGPSSPTASRTATCAGASRRTPGCPSGAYRGQPGAVIPAPAGRSSQARTGGTGSSTPLLHKAAAPSPEAASHRAARSRSAGRALAEPPDRAGRTTASPTPYRCTCALNVLSFEPAWFISLWSYEKAGALARRC